MADVVGTAFSVGNGFSTTGESPTDMLVAAYKKTRQKPLDALTTKQSTLEKRQIFFNGLKSRLQSLQTQIDAFTASDASTKFGTKKITASNTTALSVSNTNDAVLGSNTLRVDRLASSDSLISNRVALSSSFAGGAITGAQNFAITVNGTTSNVSVTLDGTETNEQALTKISAAINTATDSKVTASSVKDTSTTARLTLTSKDTGAENQISFSDSAGGVLAALGITNALNADPTNRTVSTATTAGFRKGNSGDLDSKIQVNGVEVTRASNTISDVLSGVTFNLLKPQEATEADISLSTTADVEKLSGVIKPILDAYNEILSYFKNNASTLKGDSTSSLQSRLRGLSAEEVTSVTSGFPKYLSEIGIKTSANGSLAIDNKTTLENVLKDNPQKIAELFTSSDSFTMKLSNSISNYIGDDSIITSRTKSLSSEIKSLMQRKRDLESRIDREAETMKRQYIGLQKMYAQAQAQYGSFLNMSF